METTEKPNKPELAIIPIDKSIEKYRGKVLFPDKLIKANEILAKAPLPEISVEKK